jgi:hypothetical protein
MKRTTIQMLLLILGLALSFTFYTPRTLSSNSHGELKLITAQNWGHQPVEVTDLRLNGKPLALGRSFKSNESDWIRELSFNLRNTSDKPISHARFELQFPLKDTPRRAFYVQELEYGQASALSSSTKSMKPGETVELTLNVNVDLLKKIVREKAVGQYLNMNTAQLSAEIIEFTDKTSWVAGEWMRFDDQKNKWIEIVMPKIASAEDPGLYFQPVSLKAPQAGACSKPTHDFIDCPSDCGCGVRHDIAVAGDIVTTGYSEVDKIQSCCTKNGVLCVVAYTGLTTGCRTP